MSTTEYETGDEIARGLVTECPKCRVYAMRNGECLSCYYNEDEQYDPFEDEDYRRGL